MNIITVSYGSIPSSNYVPSGTISAWCARRKVGTVMESGTCGAVADFTGAQSMASSRAPAQCRGLLGGLSSSPDNHRRAHPGRGKASHARCHRRHGDKDRPCAGARAAQRANGSGGTAITVWDIRWTVLQLVHCSTFQYKHLPSRGLFSRKQGKALGSKYAAVPREWAFLNLLRCTPDHEGCRQCADGVSCHRRLTASRTTHAIRPRPYPMSASFVFVHLDGPVRQDGTSRKRVRSQAAIYSHRTAHRRGGKAPIFHGLPLGSQPSGSPASTSSPGARDATPPAECYPFADQGRTTCQYPESDRSRQSPSSLRDCTPENPTAQIPLRHPSDSSVREFCESAIQPLQAVQSLRARQKPGSLVASNSGRKRSHSRSLVSNNPPRRTPDERPASLSLTKIPVEICPVPYQKWYDGLLEFWYCDHLPRCYGLMKTTAKQMDSYIAWSRSIALTDPALFYTTLFIPTGILVANGQMDLGRALWLRGQVVAALNEALDDPVRATSDAIISAVGKIAMHEHIYGDRQASHRIHRPAQQRMIAMRGGVQNLGLPPITLQLMVWYDALMAAESGTPAYFADLPKNLSLQPFLPDEAVRVLDASSPRRHRHPGYGWTVMNSGAETKARCRETEGGAGSSVQIPSPAGCPGDTSANT